MKFSKCDLLCFLFASMSVGCATPVPQSPKRTPLQPGDTTQAPSRDSQPDAGQGKPAVSGSDQSFVPESGSWVCKDWKKLGERFVLKVLSAHTPPPRAKKLPGSASIRFPGSIRPAQYLLDGSADCEPASKHFGCRVSNRLLIEPTTALVPMCGPEVTPRLPRIVSAYQSITEFGLKSESDLDTLQSYINFCAYPRLGPNDHREIREDRVVRRKLEYHNETDGTCSLEIENVPSHLPDVEGPMHYYVFTRIFRNLKDQRLHAVTVAFITPEMDWPLLSETIKESANSLEVDWQTFLKRYEIHSA